MVETLLCAICGERTAPDVDHVEIKAETVLMKDRNEHDEYVFCMDCAIEKFDEWSDPV
jgi:hypothetical protein